MRIAFLCGGLEAGRDGVGDYTRAIAAECVRAGHVCLLVALNDRWAAGITAETQTEAGVRLPVLRCAAALPWAERTAGAQAAVEEFAADWVSLQFVPYAYHPKGIPWRLARTLPPLIGPRPLHVMAHELWIGFGANAPLKERLVGAVQRQCLLHLFRRLRPRRIATSNATYAALLQRGGITAAQSPIFGNIPVAEDCGAALRDAVCGPENAGCMLGLFFGTIHSEWQPEPLFGTLCRAVERRGIVPHLVAVGRIGASGGALWSKWEDDYRGRIAFHHAGELPPERISAWLRAADFGIATTPRCLIGKSGTAAAMLDHGLPVIITREDAPWRGAVLAETAEPLFHRCDAALEGKLAARRLPKGEVRRRTAAIAAQFLEDLRMA